MVKPSDTNEAGVFTDHDLAVVRRLYAKANIRTTFKEAILQCAETDERNILWEIWFRIKDFVFNSTVLLALLWLYFLADEYGVWGWIYSLVSMMRILPRPLSGDGK